MIRRKIGRLMVASAFAFALSLIGAMAVLAANTPAPGSDMAADIQTGQAGDQPKANDSDSAEEVGVDDGQVDQLDEIDNGNTSASTTN